MPQNSIQNQDFYPQPKVVSISKNTEKREPIKYKKPHCIIPVEDMSWVLNQAKNIQSLWNECWQSDPFGSRFVKLRTNLKDTAFRLARRALYTAGLFEFKRDTCIDDSRKTAGWLIVNLHGARRIQEFWNEQKIDDINSPSIDKSLPISVTDSPISVTDSPISRANPRSISSETIANSGVSEPLRIYSLSSQELLKEVPEEELTQESELVGQVPTFEEKTKARILELQSRGTKIADKLAAVLERGMKHAANVAEEPEQRFRELFISRYKWKIDDQRFQQLLELTKKCTLSFFGKFKYVYENDGMSAPFTFDKAMSLVIKNASSINESVKLQLEAFNYQPTS